MAIPVYLYAFSAAQALPAAATLGVWGRHAPAPYPRLALWCALLVGNDVLDVAIGYRYGVNAFTAFIALPIEVALCCWILGAWQTTPGTQRAFRVLVPGVLAAAALALLLTEPARTFEVFIAPALALTALIATLFTLVVRSAEHHGPLTAEGWFWVCLGLALFWVGFVPVPAFIEAFVADRRDWALAVLKVRPALGVVAFVLMAWGVVCSRVRARSPGHS